MARRRRMSALQRKYFGKRKARRVSAVSVPRRKKTRRYVSMARYRRHRSGGRRGGLGLGGMKSMISPVLAGVADSYLDPMLPIDGVGATAVGMFMHNETMKNLGLYKVGFSIGNIIPLPGRSGTSSGGLL
jgi:hypothetical protein